MTKQTDYIHITNKIHWENRDINSLSIVSISKRILLQFNDYSREIWYIFCKPSL